MPPGRVTIGKSFSLISLGFINQALWALFRELQWIYFVLFHFANIDWFLSHRMVGGRVRDIVALHAAPPCVRPCCGEVAAGWASKSQPVTVGSTSQGGETDSFVPDLVSWSVSLQRGSGCSLYSHLSHTHICICDVCVYYSKTQIKMLKYVQFIKKTLY